jgi:putative DNA methylase
VALPLEAINAASAREKSIRHGHPSTLHLWWSRKPLATCRAVLFASIVDDPSSRPEEFPTEEVQEAERQRLFRIIEDLVKWDNTNNEAVLNEARQEILKATDSHPPPVLDPFCGGGSILLEAQRLGLEAHGSDLNPVAVLITKALIEIPPKFSGMPPVNLAARKNMQKKIEGQDWPGASGLAEDVRYYGKWMRDEAEKRIGHLYPKAKLPDGSEAMVIAWLWARTVKCPNPACGAMMPLVNKFELSTKKNQCAWVKPIVDSSRSIRFEVMTGKGAPKGTVNRQGARCIACGTPVKFDHIRTEGKAGRMGAHLMAIVAGGKNGRIYLQPSAEHVNTAKSLEPTWRPDVALPHNPRDFKTPNYGMSTFASLFTPRQLVTLTTFSDLVDEARKRVLADATAAGLPEGEGIAEEGMGARAYADAVATYLAFAVDKMTTTNCAICIWQTEPTRLVAAFSRQAIPMTWDYAEANPFSQAAGDYKLGIGSLTEVLDRLIPDRAGFVQQLDASAALLKPQSCISTDPPYFDNIGYADLSDYFYIWLRHCLYKIYPDLFSTLLTPKVQELVATPYRFGGDKAQAEDHYLDGMSKAFGLIRANANNSYPVNIFYAFKQAETEKNNKGEDAAIASTGWEKMLEGLIHNGFSINGTWPMRTELTVALKINVGALASSIVLVCRPRPEDAPIGTRKEFISAMKRELPEALRQLQRGNIAPVDLAQAAIGPGMAIFSRYSKVLEADGNPMRVRTALQLINVHLDEYLTEQEGEYDSDTRWALSWFEQYGMDEGPFGDAETLSKAKNTSVQGMVEAGILKAGVGKARLLRREEMDPSWDPSTDRRLTVWEATQHLILALEARGEDGAAELQQKLGGFAHNARDLAYRLYSICEQKGWAQEALAYNGLVIVWPRLSELHKEREAQRDLESFNSKT